MNALGGIPAPSLRGPPAVPLIVGFYEKEVCFGTSLDTDKTMCTNVHFSSFLSSMCSITSLVILH